MVADTFSQLLALGLDLLQPLHVFLEGAECLIVDILVLYGWKEITIESGNNVLRGCGVGSESTIEICWIFHWLIDVSVRDIVFA